MQAVETVENVLIQKMHVFVGSEEKQKQTISCLADKAGAIFGMYFVAHDADGGNHAFYLDDASVTEEEDFLEPTLPSAGWTSHRVAIAEGASATQIATAIKTAMNTVGTPAKFVATSVGKVVTFTLAKAGYAHPARDAYFSAKKTKFAFRIQKLGFAETSIGAIEGDIEVANLGVSVKDIQIHSTGETSRGQIVTGVNNPELTFNQFESDPQSIKRALLMIGGQTMLPEIEDAEEAVGYGTVALGGQLPRLKTKLVPVANQDGDQSGVWSIWAASFNLDKLTFSGTEFQTVPLKATMYPDQTKPEILAFFGIGNLDWLATT